MPFVYNDIVGTAGTLEQTDTKNGARVSGIRVKIKYGEVQQARVTWYGRGAIVTVFRHKHA